MNKLNLNLYIETEIADRKGKIVYTNIEESKCLLKNFAVWLRVAFIFGNTQSIYDTSNVLRSLTSGFNSSGSAYYGYYGLLYADSGDDTYGIQVGSGDTGVSRDDYALITKILHGVTTDKLSYGSTTIENESQYLDYTQMRAVRVFTNNSSATVIVTEAGLVIRHIFAGGAYSFLIARDLLGTPLNLAVGYTLTIRYIFRVSV